MFDWDGWDMVSVACQIKINKMLQKAAEIFLTLGIQDPFSLMTSCDISQKRQG